MKKLKTYANAWFFLGFWFVIFFFFTLLPIITAIGISFTSFDMVNAPVFVGFSNYIRMFLDDDIFVKAFANTMLFAIITGPVGYILSFTVAWLINDMSRQVKNILTFLFYSPSLIGSSYMMWMYLFSNDSYGILNSFLLNWGIIKASIQWLYDPEYNFFVVVVVILWMGMGNGFLSFVAGFKQLNKSYYEAAAIDGLKNRWQELWYITLPQMRPQLLIGAVLSVSGAFAVGAQNAVLTGMPSTDYSTHTLVLHIQDYGNTRLEMGYASSVAVVLFVIMTVSWVLINKAISAVSPSEG